MLREWKELLLSGLPLYEPVKDQQLPTPLDPVELQRQEILRQQDYDDYTVSSSLEFTDFAHFSAIIKQEPVKLSCSFDLSEYLSVRTW